jgi:hypothetical protein
MFSVHFTGGDRATVPYMERVRFAATRQRDFSTNHQDARVPVMGVVGVYLTRFQASIEDLVTFTPEIGFELALVHDNAPDRHWFVIAPRLRDGPLCRWPPSPLVSSSVSIP